jgi:molybdopterin-guanine dinucleotide biosynthesis protein A
LSIRSESTSVVVQAGGQGRRLGAAKALAELAGRPLIEHVLAQVGGLGCECLITTNQPEELAYLGLRMVSDPADSAGALTGLGTALRAAAGERALVVGCDMPFVRPRLAQYLIGLAEQEAGEEIVVPLWRRGLEPLLSVYPKSALPAVDEVIGTGSQRLHDLLDLCPLHIVPLQELMRLDPEGLSFFNVNTPEDMVRAEEICARLTQQKG